MSRSLFILILILLGAPLTSPAFPRVIAKKILERSDSTGSDFEFVDRMSEAIIKGAEEITVHKVEVGNPSVSLDVLVISPRNYGFNVKGGVDEKGMWKFGIGAECDSKESVKELLTHIQSPKLRKIIEEGGESTEMGEDFFRVIEYHARKGDQKFVSEKPKTIFVLNGFGVSNRASLVWALILAKKGYQVIAPDLRGFGRSEGKGPTYGKHEVQDLTQLLNKLQSSGIVTGKSVGVIGISYGAAMASLWAANDSRVEATVLIAPYAQADETLMSAAEAYKANLKFPFPLKPEVVRKGAILAEQKLGVTWESISPAKAIPAISHPVLFITSSGDKLIPPSVVKGLYETAAKGSVLTSFEKNPHEVLGYNVDDAAPLILEWLETNYP